MKIRKKRPKKIEKSPISHGAIGRENLPYPVIYYPNSYGTFFAFAKDESSPVVLCLCSKPIIENLIRLKKLIEPSLNSNPLRMAPLDSWFFPDIIAKKSLKYANNPTESLEFVEGLCHRCNLITPSLRYCHEMYGVEFIQHFGWYYNQAYLRLGIYPGTYMYLPEICPSEYQEDIKKYKEAQLKYQQEYDRLIAIVYGPDRNDIAPNEITYWHNVKMGEEKKMVRLRREAQQLERSFTKKIENIVRKEFGFKKVGEGWVCETILYQIVCRILYNHEILRHYRPVWLEGLELDIYIPSLKLAFEYQGQQHFQPLQVWGGQKALQDLRVRDARKVEICNNLGIKLITIDYTEPLVEDYIRKIFIENGFLINGK